MRRQIAVLLALLLAACAGDRTNDATFNAIGAETTLKGRLFSDRNYDYDDVDLTLHQGRLLLTGTMRTEEGRAVLVERARSAKGVREVIDSIVVGEKTTRAQGFEDGQIHEEIRARWIGRRTVDSRNFKMSVSRGVVYVLGRARDAEERDAALDAARNVKGVTQVVSYVTLLFGEPAAY